MALQRKEEATASKRAVLARLEAAIHALTDAEVGSGAASELARQAAEELEDRLQVEYCHGLLSLGLISKSSNIVKFNSCFLPC